MSCSYIDVLALFDAQDESAGFSWTQVIGFRMRPFFNTERANPFLDGVERLDQFTDSLLSGFVHIILSVFICPIYFESACRLPRYR